MDLKQKLVSWLRDTHAVELTVEKILSGHARAAKGYPELVQRLEAHVKQTREHAGRIERCLGLLGDKPSATEGAVGKILGAIQAAATALLGDAVVTNTAADYAVHQLEVSTYEALIAAAETADQEEIAGICRQILAEKEKMAEWIREYLPLLTEQYLAA